MHRLAPLALAGLLLGCGGAAAQPAPAAAPAKPHPHHEHRFEDPAKWSKQWDAAERDAWQKPDAVIAALALPPDATVADVGAGTGYFSVRFARAVPQGRVYAIDVEPKMVEHLRERAAREGLKNLEAVVAAPDDPRIPAPVDVVFLSNTYHHIAGREAWFRELRASLKPNGRVVIVDYRPDVDSPGPPKAARLAPSTVEAEMKAAGYRLAASDTALLPRQYVLTFVPAG